MEKIIFIFCLISFSLFSQKEETQKAIIVSNDSLNSTEIDVPFAVIEDIPLAPGCENVERSKRIECFNTYMTEHIHNHFKYPKKAARKNIQGEVIISFIINKEGNLEKIQTLGKYEILNEEAKRIILLLPKFKPGLLNGIPVKVKYSIPINFRLTK